MDAESLEEMDGGINAFVHLELSDDHLAEIESVKHTCGDCGEVFTSDPISNYPSLHEPRVCCGPDSPSITSSTDPA